MLSGDLPIFHSSPETGQEEVVIPGCLGKLGSLEWQLQETQP